MSLFNTLVHWSFGVDSRQGISVQSQYKIKFKFIFGGSCLKHKLHITHYKAFKPSYKVKIMKLYTKLHHFCLELTFQSNS